MVLDTLEAGPTTLAQLVAATGLARLVWRPGLSRVLVLAGAGYETLTHTLY